MKNVTKSLIAVAGAAVGVLQIPAVQQLVASIASQHKGIAALIVGIGGIAALIHDPKPGA